MEYPTDVLIPFTHAFEIIFYYRYYDFHLEYYDGIDTFSGLCTDFHSGSRVLFLKITQRRSSFQAV